MRIKNNATRGPDRIVLLFIAFIFTILSGVVHSQVVQTTLRIYSVAIASKTHGALSGYLMLPVERNFDSTPPDALSHVLESHGMASLYKNIELTAKMPTRGPFYITTEAPIVI